MSHIPAHKDVRNWPKPLLIAAVVFLVAAATSAALVWRIEESRLNERRAALGTLAGAHATALQLNIERSFSASYALAALVRQGNGTVRDFESVAREMLAFYQGVAALELAPRGVVRQVVPREGNEGAIGHDLLKDPQRDREALLAVQTGKLTLAGPFNLMQGGFGAVARLPVFLDSGDGNQKFWGFVCVLIRFPQTLDPAQLATLTRRGLAYELWRNEPKSGRKQIVASSSGPLWNPVHRAIELPNSRWVLSVAPSGGWGDPLGMSLMVITAITFSLLLAWLTKLLMEAKLNQAGLETLVEERTAQIRESEERLRSLADNLPDSYVYRYTRENEAPRFLEVSAGVEKIHGVTVDEVLHDARALHGQVNEDIRAALLEAEHASTAALADFHLEVSYAAADGRSRWLQLHSRPRRQSSGAIVWDGVATDITARKEMESALRAERDFSDAVLNTLPSIFYMFDTDLKLLRWNRRFEEVTGFDPAQLTGMGALDFFSGEDRERVAARIAEVFERGEADVEATFSLKEGTSRAYYLTGVKLHTREGDCLVGVGVDITEHRAAKEAAEAANSAKSQFLANMSHELRTPLAGMLGMLHLALQEDVAPATRQYLEKTVTSARALLRILNDILDMTNIVAGRLAIKEEPFLLRECLSEVIEIVSFDAERKGLPIVLSVEAGVPEAVVGDQVRLRQVLLNLVGNAVKFTENGRVEVRVARAGNAAGGKKKISFSVTDTGVGIPESKRDLIFRPFTQVDSSYSRSFGGSGLGLAISSQIVQLLGGSIDFESTEGKGSTFCFIIPLAEAVAESVAAQDRAIHPSETPPRAAGDGKGAELLIAEDDPTVRDALRKILTMSGYDVQVAEDGQEALEKWQEEHPDLILMDIQMPRMDGFEATRAIREEETVRGGHIPIIAVTAHALKEDERKCLAAGMDAYISKPVDVRRVLALIRQFVTSETVGATFE
ncbi:response regulator [Geomonas sp. RF6]|uniref:response regulator n=1 Tax=Geomonas sp. RF6 TaxID=2897342 RepID=UPI001E5975F7|nr:response regulator [Geomonas sp. RF6]UFS71755.1 response regulator [Geomonas sp. RF6]